MDRLLRSAWVEIDLGAIDYNVKNIGRIIGDSKPIGVMKADAYGHGLEQVAQVLRNNGYEYFAVATLEEAITLRECGAKEHIFVMGVITSDLADVAVKYKITPIIGDYDNAKAFSDESEAQGTVTECFVAVDTGMSRVGFMSEDRDALLEGVKRIAELPGLKICGLHSHFATSDEADKRFSELQLKRFNECYDLLRENGIEIPGRALANSAAIIDIPEAIFEFCRPGFILYGVYPSDEVHKERLELKFAMTVKAKIVFLKDIHEGDTVGYGRKYTAPDTRRIATLPLGFADGLPRAYSPVAHALVNGYKVPIVGNICMDQCMIDVTDVPNVEIGTEVILLGSDGKNSITAEEIVDSIPGMAVDELTHGLVQRMPRIYIQ